MSTIDPTRVDPTKPETGDASTAVERQQRQVLQDELSNAKTDIEALEADSFPDAPVDGKQYARKDGLWDEVIGEVGEAPADGTAYGRQDAGWTGVYRRTEVDSAISGAITGHEADPDPHTQYMQTTDYDSGGDGVVDAAQSIALVLTNTTGSTLQAGQLVVIDDAGNITGLADSATATWAQAMVAEQITNGLTGRVVAQGVVAGINTSAYGVGENLYTHTGGTFTNTPTLDDGRIQYVAEVLSSGVSGGVFVDITQDTEIQNPPSYGVLGLSDGSTHGHLNGSLTTWSEVVPTGVSVLIDALNMVQGTNAGRIRLDFSNAPFIPAAGTIAGMVTIHLSIEPNSSNDALDVSFGLNGDIATADLRATMGVGGNQSVGSIFPVTLTVGADTLTDGDEISIMTRGTIGTFTIHAFSIGWEGSTTGTAGGGGGITDHSGLTGRTAPGSHPATAVSNAPAGTISATDVQSAINELDTEKEATGVAASLVTAHDGDAGAHTGVFAPAAHVGATGAAHGAVTTGVNGFMSSGDKTKLDGVAAGANNYSHPNHSGHVTSAGDGVTTIQPDVVTNAMLSNMAQNTIKLRNSPGAGDPEDVQIVNLSNEPSPAGADVLLGQKSAGGIVKIPINALPGATSVPEAPGDGDHYLRRGSDGSWHSGYTEAEADAAFAPSSHPGSGGSAHPVFTSVVAGFTPASGGGTSNFLRADGTWQAPAGGGGIGKGTPFVVGDILAAETDAGDGTAETVGFAAADVARLSQANTFQGIITVDAANTSGLIANDQASPSGKRQFAMGIGGGIRGFSTKEDNGDEQFNIATVNASDILEIGDVAIPAQLHGSGAITRDGTIQMLENGRAATIGTVGYAATTKTQASGGTFKPEPLDRNFVQFTGSSSTTVSAMTEDGAVTLAVPDGLVLNLSAYEEVGTQASGRAGLLECRKVGTALIAAWV